MVSPQELDADGASRSGGKDVEDAAAAGHLPGAGDRILAPIAALVEGLEEDLRRHLLAARAA